MAKIAVSRKQPQHDHDADWAALLNAVDYTFNQAKGPLFCTNAEGLNTAFLSGLGAEKAIHDCYACRRFIENYGGLVTISEDGFTNSAFWDSENVPEFYRPVIAKMAQIVAKARIVSPFLSSDKILGAPETGTWTHFGARNPSVYQRARLTAGQAIAAKCEDRYTLARALDEYTPAMLKEAARLFEVYWANSFLSGITFEAR